MDSGEGRAVVKLKGEKEVFRIERKAGTEMPKKVEKIYRLIMTM